MAPDQTMMPGGDTRSPGDEMDMGLGGNARSTVLAMGMVEQLTAGPLAWLGQDVAAPTEVAHTHAAGFIYAAHGRHTVMLDGEERTLEKGQAMFLEHGADHTHARGSFWEITLATLQPEGPAALENARVLFVSEPLEGIPEPPVSLSFVKVELPADRGETAIHAHPGPEFIYVTSGDLEYETALNETERLSEGDHRGLPPDTAVQKRNRQPEPAAFLSWFVLDPDRPFSSDADFD